MDVIVLLLLSSITTAGSAFLPKCGDADRTLFQAARHTRHQLKTKVFPFWYDTSLDRDYGGYNISYGVYGPAPTEFKQLASQSRNVYGFSLAHINGFSTKERDYLSAAKHGYEFIKKHFLDRQNGGYYWTTDLRGRAVDRKKILYGQAFVIYSFVEYHRASGEPQPLLDSMQLFEDIETHARDREMGGWVEDMEANWTWIVEPVGEGSLSTQGLKTNNAHLHLVEAYTELYEITGNETVKTALEDLIDINRRYFYPPDPREAVEYRRLNWTIHGGFPSESYGHNIEIAWLIARAERIMGVQPNWGVFNEYMEHGLDNAYDDASGGLLEKGEKVWWAQAELMSALAESLVGGNQSKDVKYRKVLSDLVQYVDCNLVDSGDGMWLWSAEGEGAKTKASQWKAMYHDIRARVKFFKTLLDG